MTEQSIDRPRAGQGGRRLAAGCILALAACLSGIGSAAAQRSPTAGPVPPAAPPALAALLDRPDHRQALLAAGQRALAGLPDPCPSATWRTNGQVGIIQPIQSDRDGKPIAGAWKEILIATGCGGTREVNVLTAVGPDGTLASDPLLPGDTITDPILQRDSVPFAAAAFGPLPEGCDKGVVVDTKFDGYDGPPNPAVGIGRPARPWHETWTLSACGKRAPVTMRFTPDATGTAVKADPAGSEPRPAR